MNWMTLTVATTTEGSEMVSQLLMDAGSSGTMIEDKNDVALNQRPEGQWDIIDEEIARRIGDDVKVTGYYPLDEKWTDTYAMIRTQVAGLRASVEDIDFGKLEVSFSQMEDEDWAESWKKQYKPFRLGEHIVIKPSWTEYECQPGDRIIKLDPGLAFGTGTHETTGMCTALLEQYVKEGDDVIDVGTGTGILAIAAALTGAKHVLATDLDEMAVRVAAENVADNDLTNKITCRQGDLLKAVDEMGDVVVANIIADVIVMLAAPVKAHIRAGGHFICSGIVRERLDDVLKALNDAGYTDLDIRTKGEWAAVCAVRP